MRFPSDFDTSGIFGIPLTACGAALGTIVEWCQRVFWGKKKMRINKTYKQKKSFTCKNHAMNEIKNIHRI